MKRALKKFYNLLKAARLERPLIPLSSIMLVVAFANKINIEIFILIICCVLMYAVGGIINAKIDKDYTIKHPLVTILAILIPTLILSLYSYIIFFTVLASFLLGFIYSRFSRFILFGDSVVLALTHSTLPIVSASLLLQINYTTIIALTGFMFFAIALVAPMKNLNGIQEDKKRGYATLMTRFNSGKFITSMLFDFYFILLFSAFFIFGLGVKFLFVFVAIFMLKGFITYLLNEKKEVEAYRLARLVIILFSFAVVFDKSANAGLILLSDLFVALYLVYLFR